MTTNLNNPILLIALITIYLMPTLVVEGGDNNRVYSPCKDTTVQKDDGFTLGFAFATNKNSFFQNNNLSLQLSPCDKRLPLSGNAQFALFRPKVDEISLLTLPSSSLSSMTGGGYMVAFAGSKYAARSPPALVSDGSHIVTSFTLILEFKQGRLQNLYWKRDGCASCQGSSNIVCLNKQECGIKLSNCKSQGGSVDCSLGIQLAFSGTDKHYSVLNSWYEVENLRQYSLFGLYSNLRQSLTDQFNKFF
ncbi:uncharacterized protein LOC141586957 [Silene latifolia]|uniref:uncharacterized protein LOC141586957 n=1 Tax=Silene latifolia TaxID=37657 RepID=UPI003D7817FE